MRPLGKARGRYVEPLCLVFPTSCDTILIDYTCNYFKVKIPWLLLLHQAQLCCWHYFWEQSLSLWPPCPLAGAGWTNGWFCLGPSQSSQASRTSPQQRLLQESWGCPVPPLSWPCLLFLQASELMLPLQRNS